MTKRENRKRPCEIPMENDGTVSHRNAHTFSPFANTPPVRSDCKADNACGTTIGYEYKKGRPNWPIPAITNVAKLEEVIDVRWLGGGASCPHSEKMKVRTQHLTEKNEQDADQDYPQSGTEIQIICLWSSSFGGRCFGTNTRSWITTPVEQSPDLQWLRL